MNIQNKKNWPPRPTRVCGDRGFCHRRTAHGQEDSVRGDQVAATRRAGEKRSGGIKPPLRLRKWRGKLAFTSLFLAAGSSHANGPRLETRHAGRATVPAIYDRRNFSVEHSSTVQRRYSDGTATVQRRRIAATTDPSPGRWRATLPKGEGCNAANDSRPSPVVPRARRPAPAGLPSSR